MDPAIIALTVVGLLATKGTRRQGRRGCLGHSAEEVGRRVDMMPPRRDPPLNQQTPFQR
jgi:hypothetical protein